MVAEVSEISFEELEKQWGGMLRRFASWRIDGYDYDDLYQELRIVLYNAQRSYDATKGAAFITYLWRSCLNKVGKIRHQSAAQKRIPRDRLVSLCTDNHPYDQEHCPTCHVLPQTTNDTEVFDLLEGTSPEARRIAELSLYGETTRSEWLNRGMTPQQIKKGVKELRELMQGGKE